MMAHWLEDASRGAEQIARNLATLAAAAKDNHVGVSESCVRQLIGLLNLHYWPIKRNEGEFNRCFADPTPLRVGSYSFPNSHVAAVDLANSILDRLWYHLDPAGRDTFLAETSDLISSHGLDNPSPNGHDFAVRTGFEAAIVRSQFEPAKDVIAAWFDDDKRQAINELASRISRERSFLPHSTPPRSHFLMVDLTRMTGLSSATLNKYAKHAEVETPGRGKKNHRFSASDVESILRQIVAGTSERKLKDRCEGVLRDLIEIES